MSFGPRFWLLNVFGGLLSADYFFYTYPALFFVWEKTMYYELIFLNSYRSPETALNRLFGNLGIRLPQRTRGGNSKPNVIKANLLALIRARSRAK